MLLGSDSGVKFRLSYNINSSIHAEENWCVYLRGNQIIVSVINALYKTIFSSYESGTCKKANCRIPATLDFNDHRKNHFSFSLKITSPQSRVKGK